MKVTVIAPDPTMAAYEGATPERSRSGRGRPSNVDQLLGTSDSVDAGDLDVSGIGGK